MDRERTPCINNVLTHNSTLKKIFFSSLFVGALVSWLFFFLSLSFVCIFSPTTSAKYEPFSQLQKTIAVMSCVRYFARENVHNISCTRTSYDSFKLSTHSSHIISVTNNFFFLIFFSFLLSFFQLHMTNRCTQILWFMAQIAGISYALRHFSVFSTNLKQYFHSMANEFLAWILPNKIHLLSIIDTKSIRKK